MAGSVSAFNQLGHYANSRATNSVIKTFNFHSLSALLNVYLLDRTL